MSDAPDARFHTKYIKDELTKCWNWQGSTATAGYGIFFMNGENVRAHRASYQLHKGPIPKGLFVCHTCDNRACVNPDHLWLGTGRDNVLDMVSKGRQTSGSKSNLAVLRDEDVIFIRSSNLLQRELGEMFGVKQHTISRILSGHTWKHLINTTTPEKGA